MAIAWAHVQHSVKNTDPILPPEASVITAPPTTNCRASGYGRSSDEALVGFKVEAKTDTQPLSKLDDIKLLIDQHPTKLIGINFNFKLVPQLSLGNHFFVRQAQR